jgi:hypothetical protein
MKKLILIFVTILIASCWISNIDINTPSQTNFIQGSTLSAIVDKHGSPHSVVTRDTEVSMTYFVGIYSKHTVRLGFGARIERYVLTFDSNDRLVDETSAFLTGSIGNIGSMNMVYLPRGMSYERDFQNIGNFLLSKGIFFNEERWNWQQNRAYMYFQFLQSGEIPCGVRECPKSST